jgi:hypothetical protein
MPVRPILDVTEVRAHDTDDREHRPQLVFTVSLVVLGIAQMGRHLGLQRRLQHLPRQRRQQPIRAGQLDPTLRRRLHQLPCQASHVRLPDPGNGTTARSSS